jgi:hypothetical protein
MKQSGQLLPSWMRVTLCSQTTVSQTFKHLNGLIREDSLILERLWRSLDFLPEGKRGWSVETHYISTYTIVKM